MIVNLISDTVTQPSPGMLEAMFKAKVGDDVFKEDPSVNAFEEEVAALFGKEAALFFPSGTMTNQTAIKIHTQPGDQLICDHYAHIFNYEGGGVSFNSGVSCKMIQGDRGRITADQVEACINPPDFYHSPRTSLVCLENTTNKGGGAVYDFEEIKKIRTLCDREKLALHLDGARLWNALEVTQQDPKEYGAVFDTISLCFSKGLGCPVGSVLVGSQEDMREALRIRKVFGGGMRQAGYLAAAGSYALTNHRKDLNQDHKRAKEIAKVLEECSFIDEIQPVTTNIIIFSLKSDYDEVQFVQALKEKGILIIGLGKGKLRMVTHRDYTQEQHSYLLTTLSKMEVYA
ncbi:aminotransferase class I/II-fold pyridoxal phosphate-dependent enzyme [Flavobacteriaceae bacterium]|jgi:threonine aldolase|nr:aminotransferase class I/II-fold pyridoxal phosphate-dependent enzyme [Flavobacteriaceae bacterium]MDA8644268.1 aminotransferase class I/II-fold pyridoxal phosphate-dependent enzyme [Flavobacteriaceae bacterium]MDA9037687.1 aminotransferase class I/II-fold pyridoxal phosphate-dependent enzyme [Flavobacteriaceae bacterium]MDA9588276.1 aminotransferase class I/II-fold pyridoxal phosphate-dependent enzyme [Flavobacteriaceae bacterium]MDA9851608.1 aminotransferase class I/II-fold pyridoxal phosp